MSEIVVVVESTAQIEVVGTTVEVVEESAHVVEAVAHVEIDAPSDGSTAVIEVVGTTVCVEASPEVVEVLEGPMGPRGIPGPTGPAGSDGTTFDVTAGEAISALRCVKVVGDEAFLVDSGDASDATKVIGITTTAAGAGASITVRTDGPLTDAAWSWTPGSIYCGALGVLTQSPPASGFVCEVARAKFPTSIVIDVQTPFIRG